VLKNSLPVSKQFIKNKRVFNEQDLELFKFYKVYGLEKTSLKYEAINIKTANKTVLKPFEENQKQFSNSLPNDFKKSVMDDLETVKKQFEEKENGLKLEIEQKDKIISIREEQTQKYALLKMEEQKEKETWIKKYEDINQEKTEWIKKFYSMKTYLIVFILLFLLSTIALVIKII
jgi:frataxin-like iron-binding protein CyaY